MKSLLLLFSLTTALHAQTDPLEGLWQGYAGEWSHVTRQLLSLAEAIPAEKFSYRPVPGVRSTSEVFMHLAVANYSLLQVTGPKMPAVLQSPGVEESVNKKEDVIRWLQSSQEAVKTAHASLTYTDLNRKLKNGSRDSTVDAMYLRIIVHANEHMGQLIAYARAMGVVPPWSSK